MFMSAVISTSTSSLTLSRIYRASCTNHNIIVHLNQICNPEFVYEAFEDGHPDSVVNLRSRHGNQRSGKRSGPPVRHDQKQFATLGVLFRAVRQLSGLCFSLRL